MLTCRQQCGRKPSANEKIYAEDSVSKKTPLLAVRWCDWLDEAAIAADNSSKSSLFIGNILFV